MLRIRQLKHLAARLDLPIKELKKTAEEKDDYCRQLILLDPRKPEKQRKIVDVRGPLRTVQERIYRRILLPQLHPSDYSYGGIRGRHIKSNVEAHIKSAFALTSDISDFYPSISHVRVYRLLEKTLECSPDVSRLLTMFCTYDHHLALGLVTSPILADQVFRPIDERIAGMCETLGLTYTRFVDDICISGPFDLSPEKAGIDGLLEKIIAAYGFQTRRSKRNHGSLSHPGMTITKLRIKDGHVDVSWEYIRELERRLDDAAMLAADKEFTGPYFTDNQLEGQVHFVCWINPGRRRTLWKKFRSIKWADVRRNAAKRNLVMYKKTFIRSASATS